jgi:HK97 family phage major capsid protein
MSALTKLKTKHAAIVAKMQTIIDKAGDELTAEQETAFAALEADADAIEKQIVRAKKLGDRIGISKDNGSDPGDEDDADDDDDADEALPTRKDAKRARDVKKTISKITERVRAKVTENMDISQKMGLVLWGMYQAKCAPEISVADHIEGKGYQVIGDMLRETRSKALNTGTLTAGAELIPEVMSAEFIQFIRPMSSIMRANPTTIPLDNGNLRITGGDQGATASYRAEGTDVAYTEATFKEKTLSAKNLSAITSTTKELLQRSPMAVAAIIQNDLAAAWVQTQDLAALRGDGTGNTPIGLRNRMLLANRITVPIGKTPSYMVLDQYALYAIELVEGSDIPTIRLAWFMPSRVRNYLRQLRGVNGEKIYPEMDTANPTWHGYPVFVSNQIPRNMGVGTNETEIYLCDMGHFWYGESSNMEMSISDEAAFVVAGNLISAWSRNLVAVKVNGSHDFQLRFDKAAVCLQGVQWGAP